MEHTFTFENAQMLLCGHDMLELMTGNVMVINDDFIGDSEMNLYLDDISDDETLSREFMVMVYNMDTKEEVCLKKCELDPYDYHYTITICESKKDLKPGRYQLTLENMLPKVDNKSSQAEGDSMGHFQIEDNSCVMEFIVVKDGKHLPHPAITSVSANRHDKTMRISMKCDTQSACHEIISIDAFNSSMTMMGHHGTVIDKTGKSTKNFCLTTPLHWADDEYKCIVSHNLQPFACISVSIQGGQVTATEFCDHDQLFDYVRITNALWSPVGQWQSLSETIGQADLKRHAIKSMKYNRIENIRCEEGLSKIRRSHNHVIIGNGGAEHREMACTYNAIDSHTYSNTEVDAAEICPKKNNPNNQESAQEFFSESYDTYIIYNTTALCIGCGPETAVRLMKKVEKEKSNIILAVTQYEWDMIRETLPDFCKLFDPDSIIDTTSYSDNDILHIAISMMDKEKLTATDEAIERMGVVIGKNLHFRRDGYEMANTMVHKHIIPKVMERWISDDRVDSTVTAEDVDTGMLNHDDDTYEQSMDELNAMTGLKEVKETLNAAFMKMKLNSMRMSMGLTPLQQCSHHTVFTGNPGTGKTTVARMMGKIMKSLGILSKGDVIMAERKTMVGQYIGETEENMTALLQRAKGNVLFIDEAYTLSSDCSDKKDYGHRVIECLLTVMAQKDSDMVIIMAGYEKEMERMMSLNEGLRGRFTHWIKFEDYTANELHDIGRHLLDNMQITMTSEADDIFRQCISKTVDGKDSHFANARWVEHFVQSGIMPMMADRIISCCHHDINASALQTVTRSDVERAFALTKPKKEEPRQRIGF